MAITVKDSGTLTADGTEQTLGSAFTDSGVYVVTVNLEEMAAADVVALRAYVKVLTGDTEKRLLYSAAYANAQGDAADAGAGALGEVVACSVPIESPYEVEFTLEQIAGTNRDFKWRVDTL